MKTLQRNDLVRKITKATVETMAEIENITVERVYQELEEKNENAIKLFSRLIESSFKEFKLI